jgi:cytochrome c oxidase assembly protein subunit 15
VPFLRRLAVASTVATLVLVAIGGLVRATKSGLGCGTDWPHCSGNLVPALESRAMALEFSHRAAAGTVLVVLGTLAVLAWRQRHRSRAVFVGAATAFALVVGQALLGAVVVKLELEATSVVLHLAAAMALLAALVYTTVASFAAEGRLDGAADRILARRARWAAACVLAVLMAGSYLSGRDAGLAFGDWPLMGGTLVPDLSVEARALHFAHRLLAGATGIVVALAAVGAIRRRSSLPVAAGCAYVAVTGYSVQVLIGAANVWMQLNSAVVTTHLFLGAIIWTSLVALVAVTRATPERRVVDRSGRTSRAALEGGR